MNEDDKKELQRLLDQYAFNGSKGYMDCLEEAVQFVEQYAAGVLHGFVGDLYQEENK